MPDTQLENGTILDAHGALQGLAGQKLNGLKPRRHALQLLRSLRGLKEAVEPLQEVRQAAIREHAERDDDGNPVRTEVGGFKIAPDRLDALEAELADLSGDRSPVSLGKAVPMSVVMDGFEEVGLAQLDALEQAHVVYLDEQLEGEDAAEADEE